MNIASGMFMIMTDMIMNIPRENDSEHDHEHVHEHDPTRKIRYMPAQCSLRQQDKPRAAVWPVEGLGQLLSVVVRHCVLPVAPRRHTARKVPVLPRPEDGDAAPDELGTANRRRLHNCASVSKLRRPLRGK